MPNSYEIRVYNQVMQLQVIIADYYSLDYALKVNEITPLTLEIPDSYWTSFGKDYQIEVYRNMDGGNLGIDNFSRWFVTSIARNDQNVMTVKASDAKVLLTRRHVLFTAGSAQASKTATAADDIMKTIILENFGASSVRTYANISTLLTIQANQTAAQVTSKSFAWQEVFSTLKSLADDSTGRGTYLAFDVVAPAAGNQLLDFRTYTICRGVDRSASVTVSPELGTMSNTTYTLDWSNEKSFIEVGGQGEGANRQLATLTDTVRIGSSLWGYNELFLDSRNTSASAQLTGEAQSEMWARRRIQKLEGDILQVGTYLYGRDYGFGDIISAQFKGQTFTGRCDQLQVSSTPGAPDVITIKFQSVTA